MNKDKQKSGLRKARTKFKIPRIKRNKEHLTKIILSCINQEKLRKLMRKSTYRRDMLQNKFMDDRFGYAHLEGAFIDDL